MQFKLWHAAIIGVVSIGLLIPAVTAQAPPSNSTSTNQTTTPSVDPTDPTCPVGGQIRVECASLCNTTCTNMYMELACPDQCATNGCQCPSGTVVDEQSNTCVVPSNCSSTGQTCPTVQSTNEDNCVDDCSSDNDCQGHRICCSNGCGGRTCSESVELCSAIQCVSAVCEGGAEPITSPFICCPFCPSQGQTCPTVQSTNEDNCVDECSSDDDCQYDRICCSNGCGGYTCSDSVEMCALIQCAWPICENGTQPVTSPFSCCPYCPTNGSTDDDGGTGVTPIASVLTVITCALLYIFF